jgi:protein SCO1
MSELRIIRVATPASIAALVTAVIVFSLLLPPATQPAESVPIGGPFALVDQDGIKVTDKTFSGKPSVIFFGFTSCSEACPLLLTELSIWLKAIGPADKLNVLFISIDPERDTSAHLKEYLSSFDPRIHGLTGTGEQIAAVAKEYRVYYNRIQLEKGVYALPHVAVIYLMDRAGKFVNQISLGADDRTAIERLRQLAAL